MFVKLDHETPRFNGENSKKIFETTELDIHQHKSSGHFASLEFGVILAPFLKTSLQNPRFFGGEVGSKTLPLQIWLSHLTKNYIS